MRPKVIVLIALMGVFAMTQPALAASPEAKCLSGSGNAGASCLKKYTGVIEKCRKKLDAVCEADAAAPGGALEDQLARTEKPIIGRCTDATAETLGYPGLDDVLARIPEACTDFSEDLLDIAFADDLGALSAPELSCQQLVSKELGRLRGTVVKEFGKKCFAKAFAGKSCDRTKRDGKVAKKRGKGRAKILDGCGADFDALGLSALDLGSTTLDERVDDVLDLVTNRARHFAQRVYPPNDLGPTAEFGPFPVGVTTLTLFDPARSAISPATGDRPVTTEVYYPSTAGAVAGMPPDVLQVLGVDIPTSPVFRDVARDPGTFPLVLFSHGLTVYRTQTFSLMTHLASHGFVVVSPDHHGDNQNDLLLGIVDPSFPSIIANRPLDISFLIDEFLAFNAEVGNLFEAAIDPGRIGMFGNSFGGFTAFTVAGGTFGIGTFTDARVKAIMPMVPFSAFLPDAFFSTITVPTLILGGSMDIQAPFPANQQRPFDNMPAGALVAGLVQLVDMGHSSLSDLCELPRGMFPVCEVEWEPSHMPWRHAGYIASFFGLNFFDAVLNGDIDALARLDPASLATIEDLVYQSK